VAKDFNQELKATNAELTKADKTMTSLVKGAKELQKAFGEINSVAGGGEGNRLSGALASFSGMSTGQKIGIGLSAFGGLVQAGSAMMPKPSDVYQRATGYYNAGVMQGFTTMGGMNQAGMYKRLADGLGKFGIQSPQATAQLAQFYGQRGVQIGSPYEGNLTRAVGGASQYLNMDSNKAAAALENLTAGAGGQSANMLRQLGIFTANPYTGEVKTQQQLFDEMHTRLTAGMPKATSASEVQDEYRRGALGYYLKNSGLSEEQQQLFYVSEMYRAETGKSLDFSNKNQLEAATADLERKGFINPQESLNAIAASEEGVLQQGQASYISGLQAAVPAIEGLNVIAGKLAETFGSLKAVIDAITSTNAGGGVAGLLGGMGSGGMAILGTLGGGDGDGGDGRGGGGVVAGGGGKKGGKKGGAKSKGKMTPGQKVKAGLKAPGVKGAGIIGAAMALGSAALNVATGAPAGASIGEGIGSVAGMVLGGAVGSIFGPGVGTFIGGTIGSVVGGGIGRSIGSMFDGGQGGGWSTGVGGQNAGSGSANTDASGAPPALRWVRPASGPITSKYGPRKPPKPGASSFHKGVDIGAKNGSPIVAAAEGKISFAGVSGAHGNHVKIKHSNGYVSTYSHLSRISVKVGDRVLAGNEVGKCGSTGVSTAPHLHFEILKSGANIDPATVVPGLGGGGTATVTNTLPSSDKKGEPMKTASDAADSGTAEASTNGSSVIGALLKVESPLNGYAATKASDYVSVSGSNVKQIPVKGGQAYSTSNTPGATTQGGQGGPTSNGSGMITDTTTSSSKRGGVVINVNIKQASDAEARRFASLVKDILDDESNLTKIGRM
jgi:hypothetical protein